MIWDGYEIWSIRRINKLFIAQNTKPEIRIYAEIHILICIVIQFVSMRKMSQSSYTE